MAGDWIKFEKATLDKPEVYAIADKLCRDPDEVVGKLLRVWCWYDQHTESGNGVGVTVSLIDRYSNCVGMAKAMKEVGWLVDTLDGLSIPNFDRHNGETAKSRALTAKRVAFHKSKTNASGNAKVTVDALPREEKRREEDNTPVVPLKGDKPAKGPLQLRAERIFNRRESTPLTASEQRAFKKSKAAIEATTEEEWKLLESFYTLPQSETYARKDLAQLVNNWNGEIDRAKAWFASNAQRNGGAYTVVA